jgi:Ca2+-binding RTX toxin-like protein
VFSFDEHGKDIIDGGDGDDTLVGSAGNDYLNGGADNDVIYIANDTIYKNYFERKAA